MGTHMPITQQSNSGDQEAYKMDILMYSLWVPIYSLYSHFSVDNML